MRLDEVTRESESSGFEEEKSFTIAANGKAFRILIDKMYSNVHQAIVRELMTNAWDAHIISGNSNPFEVHAPNVMEPFFSIRDFGCAMTHDQVMNVYSRIFESTKDARDDQVGAWGLGSKTPFAYTDTFGVQVWLEGRHRVYSVFIDSKGIPKIALALNEENDGAADGVEISFPVAPKDSGLFRKAIETISVGFDPKPIFSTTNLDIPELEPKRQGTGWFTFECDHANFNHPMARIGCVLYPLDLAVVSEFIQSNRIKCEYLNLLTEGRGFPSSHIVLDFPIGSVEVTANREDLYYSMRTVKAIIEKFDSILTSLIDEFKSNISGSETLYETNLKCLEVCDMFRDIAPDVGSYLRGYAKNLTFKGRHLLKGIRFDHRFVTKEAGKDPAGNTILERSATRYKTIEFCHFDTYKFSRSLGMRFVPMDCFAWAPCDTDVYVELPAPANEKRLTYAAARIRYNRKERNVEWSHAAIWIKAPSLTDPNYLKIMSGLGHPAIIIVNDLVKPPSLNNSSERGQTPLRRYHMNRGKWEEFDDFDPDSDAGFYVMLKNGSPVDLDNYNITAFINLLISQGALEHPGTIIGVPASRKGVLNKNREQWKLLKPHLQEAYRKIIDIKQAAIVMSVDGSSVERQQIGRIENLKIGFSKRRIRSFQEDSAFVAAVRAYDRLGEIETRAGDFRSIWNHRHILDTAERDALQKEYETTAHADPALMGEIKTISDTIVRTAKVYPLLDNFWNPNSRDFPALADYIEGIDLLTRTRENAQPQISLDNASLSEYVADEIPPDEENE